MARAAAADRQALQDLGDQHEEDDDSGDEEVAGGRPPPTMAMVIDSSIVMRSLKMSSNGRLEDRPAPDRETERADHAECGKGLPNVEPHCSGSGGDQADANGLGPCECVVVPILMITIMRMRVRPAAHVTRPVRSIIRLVQRSGWFLHGGPAVLQSQGSKLLRHAGPLRRVPGNQSVPRWLQRAGLTQSGSAAFRAKVPQDQLPTGDFSSNLPSVQILFAP